ncbi:MAG: DUF11 domain-containing protein [Actinobacteria bacterium]|nr:MAG: DUF11 domain-containing protein [Actinomycetota bacterium]
MRDETGAVAIVVVAMTVALIGMLSIVADVGLLYQQRRQLQTAVDSAALAGAMEIAEGRGTASANDAAASYVTDNAGVPAASSTISFPSGTSVRVGALATREVFFARLFGREESRVRATATAQFGPATAVRNCVPVIVPEQFVSSHTGEANAGTFTFGDDRPLDPFNKSVSVSGSTATFRIGFINTYGRTVDVSFRDPLAANLAYVDGSATGGGVYDPSDRTIRWASNGLGDGEETVLTFSAATSDGRTDNTVYADVSGESKTLSASTSGASAQRGYFWLCDFDRGSSGVPPYDQWIRQGYPEEVSIGSVANGTGMKTALKDAVEARMLSHPKVILPLFDYTEGGGSKGEYHIVGFAEFVITGYSFSGNPKSMTGYFTTGTVAAGSSQGTPPAQHGVTVLWLSE